MPPADLSHRIQAIRNTAEVIAQSLREMICTAELLPGQPLIQERIAEMFRVSRVPVRDALQLLVGMGVAVNVPRHGVIVRPLSQKHLDDLFEVRKILEGAAIRLAVQRRTPDLVRNLQELIRLQSGCLKRGDVKGQAMLDDAFHARLYEAIDNRRLLELIRSNWDMIRQARCASVVAPKRGTAWIATSIQRHKQVVDALRTQDATAAEAAVFESIESSKREIIDSLRKMRWLEDEDSVSRRSAAVRPTRPAAGRIRPPGTGGTAERSQIPVPVLLGRTLRRAPHLTKRSTE